MKAHLKISIQNIFLDNIQKIRYNKIENLIALSRVVEEPGPMKPGNLIDRISKKVLNPAEKSGR